jgi:2-polyprenyl-6-methoxyphenol hydroxylase-like FAD-dependent oxidoreductase
MRILIVGGGIGGLSAAIAFSQNGHDVLVAERQADLHASVFGVGIIQPGNALRALDRIGCAQPCLDQGYPAAGWGAMYDVDGNFLHPMPGAIIPGADYPPMNGVTRPKLHEILTGRARETGVEIRYSCSFDGLESDLDGVAVQLTDGSRERFDLVVGADGVRSNVREHVLAEGVAPRYIGQSSYRMSLPGQPEVDRIILQEGPDGMAGFVPIGKDLSYLFYNAHMEQPGYGNGDELVAELLAHLKPFGGLTGRVRDAYVDGSREIVLRPEESLIVPHPWHKDRIVLLGDAVHAITPHLGQGAAQAIEDAVVLAEVISAHGVGETAFTEYTDRRYARCKLIVETSLAIGEWEMGRLDDFDNVGATNHVLEVMAQPL